VKDVITISLSATAVVISAIAVAVSLFTLYRGLRRVEHASATIRPYGWGRSGERAVHAATRVGSEDEGFDESEDRGFDLRFDLMVTNHGTVPVALVDAGIEIALSPAEAERLGGQLKSPWVSLSSPLIDEGTGEAFESIVVPPGEIESRRCRFNLDIADELDGTDATVYLRLVTMGPAGEAKTFRLDLMMIQRWDKGGRSYSAVTQPDWRTWRIR
jgi:hypothetical protein